MDRPRPFCDPTFGGHFIAASYLAMILLVIEGTLFTKCFSQKLLRRTRFLVGLMMVTDIVACFAITATVWQRCVDALAKGPPQGPPLNTLWTIPVGALTKLINGLCQQLYLITRIYAMSKNLPWTLFLGLLSIAQLGLHLTTFASFLAHPEQLYTRYFPWHSNVSMAAWTIGAVVDILIALTVSRQLLQFDAVFRSTKSIVRKILLCAVISGGVTALCGLVRLILFKLGNNSQHIIAANMGKLYAITVFANIILVQGIRHRTVIVGTATFSNWLQEHVVPLSGFSIARTSRSETTQPKYT